MRRGFAPIVALAIAATLLIGIGATAAYFKLKSKPAPQPQPTTTPQSTSTPADLSSDLSAEDSSKAKASAKDETTNWKTYRNKTYGFEVRYPPDMQADMRALTLGQDSRARFRWEGPLPADSPGRGDYGPDANAMNLIFRIWPGQDIVNEAQKIVDALTSSSDLSLLINVYSHTVEQNSTIGNDIPAIIVTFDADIDGNHRDPIYIFTKLKTNNYLEILFSSTGEPEHAYLFDRILSTFQFLD